MTAQPLGAKRPYGWGVPLAGSEFSAFAGNERYEACADDAGIAHLVECHLAKVEVASKTVVALSGYAA